MPFQCPAELLIVRAVMNIIVKIVECIFQTTHVVFKRAYRVGLKVDT